MMPKKIYQVLKILQKINLDRTIISVLGYLSEISNIAATSFSGKIPILLSKSNYSELPELSENIYLLSTSSEVQAKLSAQYAINILEYRNIAVLSPADEKNKNYDFEDRQMMEMGLLPKDFSEEDEKELKFIERQLTSFGFKLFDENA